MKAVVIDEPGKVSLRDVPIPEPEPGFARIRVKACAVCATDLEVIAGNIAARYPLIPGHEWSGIVDSVGSEKDSAWIGRAVVGSNDVVCMNCDACRAGEWRYCEHFEEIGFKRDGAYAEYMLAPVYGLCEKSENVPFEIAALCEPLGVAIGTLKKAGARCAQTAVIFGAGSIGLCMLAVGKAMGLRRIVVCASSEKRLGIARKMGAYECVATDEEDLEARLKMIHPDGTDLVIDATGAESCISRALKILKRGGTLALAGYGRGKIMRIRVDDIHLKNLRVIGAGNNWNLHKEAMALMEDGAVDLSEFISAVMTLDEYKKALDLAKTRPENFVKAVFRNE